MNTKEAWEKYNKDGTIVAGTETLLEMMKDLCETYKLLLNMNHNHYYSIVLNDISLKYQSLSYIAWARHIECSEMPSLF